MLYNQPLSIRFGTELLRHLDDQRGIEPYWDSLDVAVAWVRQSGVSYLSESFARFLGHGGELSFVVGIDLQNTSREGLEALLQLETHGACETYVHHNEAGSVFHPKMYLFRNEEEARLVVGSNNLTAAGLYTNVEAGLQLDTKLTDNVITDAMNALESWRDTTTRLVFRLDVAFLDALVDGGYVREEAATEPPSRPSGSEGTAGGKAGLFASRAFAPPPRPGAARSDPGPRPTTARLSLPEEAPGSSEGTTVLMRLRKARGTQTQIPFRIAETFFKGIVSVRSAHSGIAHGLQPAKAHGNRNTIKLEIPELRDHSDTFARFERTGSDVLYEVHDTGTPKGDQIKASLEAGMEAGSTQTSIRDVSHATWWRYI